MTGGRYPLALLPGIAATGPVPVAWLPDQWLTGNRRLGHRVREQSRNRRIRVRRRADAAADQRGYQRRGGEGTVSHPPVTSWSGTSMDTTACAAIPSLRPVKPNRSVVVALTDIRPASTPNRSASRRIMAAAWGVIFGCSQISVTSALISRPPRAAIRSAAWRRKRALSASFHWAWLGGKWRPMSPSASAP